LPTITIVKQRRTGSAAPRTALGSRKMQIPASSNAVSGGACDAVSVALRCLIVDDDPSFLEVASSLLEREGVEIAGVASNIAEALRQTDELHPSVILVDISLGRESGFDLARRLAEANAGSTVILISTHAEADFVDLIAESPTAGFVPKSELSARAIERVVARG
jgi:DNA-binding NarL/FixJ family response regulator